MGEEKGKMQKNFGESPFLRFWRLRESGEANEIPNNDAVFMKCPP
jgi:hypothetical protein